ncbi:MAG: hypothetical protein JO332_14805 [Planctomycetaceae bacterium]|nr:hypothetical protein [Planctomycetaceae bacterium]
MNLLLAAVCALAQSPDMDAIRERIKDPAQLFPVFQELIAAGEYGTAQRLLSPNAMKMLPAEAFYLTFASYEPPRRLVASLKMHAVDGTRLRLCSPEFGVSRDFRIVKFLSINTLDFTPDDIEFLKGRTLGWYRLQVRRADGWHYAYPPDWTYAPLARSCACGK